MKRILLLFTLISGFVFSQDLKYAENLNNLSSDQLKDISEDIISGYSITQKYVKTITDEEGHSVLVYYSSDIPEKTIQADLKTNYCTLCTNIKFKKYYKNSNSDLGIKGNEVYKFVSVEGKYLDLYKWWIKHFAPKESKESLLNSNSRYLKSDTPNINLRFTKTLDIWEVMNIY